MGRGSVDQRYWLGFNRIKGVGAIRFRRLLECFGDLQAAWNAPADALRDAGLDRRTIENWCAARSSLDLDGELRRLERSGATLLTWDDPASPRNLLNITQPPPVLFVMG